MSEKPELTHKQETVLEAIVEDHPSLLREIHDTAVDIKGSPYQYSPEYGETWNEERREIQGLVYELREFGLATVDGRGKPWTPTAQGRRWMED